MALPPEFQKNALKNKYGKPSEGDDASLDGEDESESTSEDESSSDDDASSDAPDAKGKPNPLKKWAAANLKK